MLEQPIAAPEEPAAPEAPWVYLPPFELDHLPPQGIAVEFLVGRYVTLFWGVTARLEFPNTSDRSYTVLVALGGEIPREIAHYPKCYFLHEITRWRPTSKIRPEMAEHRPREL